MKLRPPIAALFSAACLAAVPARAADPQPYTVTIAKTGSDSIDATLAASAQLVTLKGKVPVPPFALIARARSDIPRLQTALDSFGYYLNTVTITIGSHALTDPGLADALDKVPAGANASVDVAIDKGPLFHLGKVEIDGAVPDGDRQSLGIKSGDPAIAGNVLDAQTRLLNALQEDGYALAKVDAPIAYADDKKHELNVSFKVEAGAQADIGAITFKGLADVNESFARRALKIKPGDRYKPSRIEEARKALVALGVFSGVTVHAADHLDADGRIPLIFDVQERKKHAVAITAAYSTDLGISLSTTWSHRNLFGNAEQLNLTAAGTGLGNSTTGLGYTLSAQFIKPLFLRPDQTLEFDVSAIKQNLDAYDQKAETVAGFLRRKFNDMWTGSGGLSYSHDEVAQESASRLYQLFSLPLTVSYDSTGIADVLRDPTKGLRASLAVTPVKSFGASDLTFFVLQASASTYFDVSGDGRSIVALRGLAGSILGGSNLELPPDQRLYAGGSATVRGFAYQSIGPMFPDGKPVGAKSVDSGTIEFRQRIGEDWGGAAFVDAGQASANGAPFHGPVRMGAGIGARYYTALGAVRLDVAVPVTRVRGGDAFEVYIGLGQAF
ncbi:MAG: BamA/TamA family outer membrane protein [Proteobacteria bacterium]|nr:BamA/TamA family outer membrane protein [Pseudomonadota bacterium]